MQDMPLCPMANRFGGCFCLDSGPVLWFFVLLLLFASLFPLTNTLRNLEDTHAVLQLTETPCRCFQRPTAFKNSRLTWSSVQEVFFPVQRCMASARSFNMFPSMLQMRLINWLGSRSCNGRKSKLVEDRYIVQIPCHISRAKTETQRTESKKTNPNKTNNPHKTQTTTQPHYSDATGSSLWVMKQFCWSEMW